MFGYIRGILQGIGLVFWLVCVFFTPLSHAHKLRCIEGLNRPSQSAHRPALAILSSFYMVAPGTSVLVTNDELLILGQTLRTKTELAHHSKESFDIIVNHPLQDDRSLNQYVHVAFNLWSGTPQKLHPLFSAILSHPNAGSFTAATILAFMGGAINWPPDLFLPLWQDALKMDVGPGGIKAASLGFSQTLAGEPNSAEFLEELVRSEHFTSANVYNIFSNLHNFFGNLNMPLTKLKLFLNIVISRWSQSSPHTFAAPPTDRELLDIRHLIENISGVITKPNHHVLFAELVRLTTGRYAHPTVLDALLKVHQDLYENRHSLNHWNAHNYARQLSQAAVRMQHPNAAKYLTYTKAIKQRLQL